MVRRYIVGKRSTDIEPGDSYSLQFVTETADAWGVSEGGFESPLLWLPKSACSLEKAKPARGGVIELWVPDWLAEQKGIV